MVLKIDFQSDGISTAMTDAPFDQALAELQQQNFSIIPLWLNAQLRIKAGYDHLISKNGDYVGNYVREGTLYNSGENIRLLRESLCLKNPQVAIQANRDGREHTDITPEDINEAIKDSLEIRARDLDEKGRNLILSTETLGTDEYGVWLFGGEGTTEQKQANAQSYGDWLRSSPQKIEQIRLCVDPRRYFASVRKAYATQVWFFGFDSATLRCGFDGAGLDYVNGVRGALINSADARKIAPSN